MFPSSSHFTWKQNHTTGCCPFRNTLPSPLPQTHPPTSAAAHLSISPPPFSAHNLHSNTPTSSSLPTPPNDFTTAHRQTSTHALSPHLQTLPDPGAQHSLSPGHAMLAASNRRTPQNTSKAPTTHSTLQPQPSNTSRHSATRAKHGPSRKLREPIPRVGGLAQTQHPTVAQVNRAPRSLRSSSKSVTPSPRRSATHGRRANDTGALSPPTNPPPSRSPQPRQHAGTKDGKEQQYHRELQRQRKAKTSAQDANTFRAPAMPLQEGIRTTATPTVADCKVTGTCGTGSGMGSRSGSSSVRSGSPVNLVSRLRSWRGAEEMLELAGGVEGRTSPQLQLEVLQHARWFGATRGGAGGVRGLQPGLSGGASGDVYDVSMGPSGGSLSGHLGCPDGNEDEDQTEGDGSALIARVLQQDEVREGNLSDDVDVVRTSTVPVVRTAAAAADEAAGAEWAWLDDWRLGWDEQVERHAPWLLAAARPAQEQPAGIPVAVVLPGHKAAAEMAAERSAERAAEMAAERAAERAVRGAIDGSWKGTVRTAAGPQHAPIPPPPSRALAAAMQRGLCQEDGTGRVAGTRDGSGGLGGGVGRARSDVGTASSKVDDRMGSGGVMTSAVAAGQAAGRYPDDEGTVRAADLLSKVVHDAVVVQPRVWTDEQVASLLRCAATLLRRYPGLLASPPPVLPSASPRQQPIPRTAAPPDLHSESSASATHRVAESHPAVPATTASRRSTPSPASRSAVTTLLRFRLQQLLLRVDGLVIPLPPSPARQDKRLLASFGMNGGESDARSNPAALFPSAAPVVSGGGSSSVNSSSSGSGSSGHRSAPSSPPASQALSVSAAVSAAWAAAVLQLRLSPGGRVRQRLLTAFRPQLRLQLRPGAAVSLRRVVPRRGRGRRGRERGTSHVRTKRRPEGWRLSAAEVAEALWALATLGMQMPISWQDAAMHALAVAGPGITTREGDDAASCGGNRGRRTNSCRAHDTGFSKSALSEYGGGRRTRRTGAALLGALKLVRLAWAVVQLREWSGREDVTKVWARMLFSATERQLHLLSPAQLVDLLWSIARGRREPNGPWRVALAGALAAAAPRLAPWQVARSIAALAKLRVCMPYKLVAALLAVMHSQLTAAQHADVAAVVWGLRFVGPQYTAALVRNKRRVLQDFAAVTQPALPSLDPAQLVQLADGFSHLGLLPGAEWMRQHREACIRCKDHFSDANRRKLRHAYARMWTL